MVACGTPQKPATNVADAAPADQEAAPDPAAQACFDEAGAIVEKVADEPARITVKHIVVKHAAAERVPDDISRDRGQACLRAKEVLDKLKAGSEFDELVGEYSDEDGAASRAGSIGEVSRDGLDPAFADAAFALDINTVSQVVESKFGFHIILRTD